MSFAPLLPDDNLAIGVRLEGLADWCGAFLAGLAAGLGHKKVKSLEELPGEAQEIIADIRAITDVDLADPEDLELGSEEDHIAKRGPAEVCGAKVGSEGVCPSEICAVYVGPSEVGAVELGRAEVGASEVGVAQV